MVGVYYPIGVDSTYVQGNFTLVANTTYIISVNPVHSSPSQARAYANVSVDLIQNYPWMSSTNNLAENILMSYTGALS